MTLISLIEDKVATIYRVDTTMKIPNPRGQVEARFWISETEKNHIRKKTCLPGRDNTESRVPL